MERAMRSTAEDEFKDLVLVRFHPRGARPAMAGGEVDLTKTKRIVRAILLSSKYGCTPKQLLSDYEQNIGSKLPYPQLGFATLMSFVTSMPDVVRVTQNGRSTVLYGVPDQTTEQISRMVSRQRAPKRPPIPRSEAGWDSPTPSAPKAPVTFSIQLRMLMLAYPSGLEVSTFQEAFVRRFNYHLSLRNWGFQSVDELLRSVPDVVTYSWDSYRRAYMIRQVPKSPPGGNNYGRPPGLRTVQRREYYNPVIPPLPCSPKTPGKNLY